jgi:sugar transferase (PEP-CTERM system associated)
MIVLENRFFPVRSAVCFVVEGAIILTSVLASFVLLQSNEAVAVLDLRDAVVRGGVVALICQTCMYFLDMYNMKYSQTWGELFFSLMFAVGFVCIGISLVSYAFPQFGVAGNMYYLTIVFVGVFLLFWRVLFDIALARWVPRSNILVVGTGQTARMMAAEIRERRRLGFDFAGFVGPEESWAERVESVVGGYGDLEGLVREKRIKNVVVAINERRGEYPVEQFLSVKVAGIPVVEWQGFFERLAGRIPIDNLPPSYFIFNEGFRKSRLVLLLRRCISVVVSLAAIVFLSPVFLITAIAIKLESPGSITYSQIRIGLHGKVFRIWKFRSMRQDAESGGAPVWARKDDPRVTRVGKIIRKIRVDELPQLFNVLKGDLDLVGPRPERPEFVEELSRTIPYYALRHTIRPGITGWAQVMFSYCGTIEESEEKLQYDLFYIKNMSLPLDLFILFSTVKIVLLGRGAR